MASREIYVTHCTLQFQTPGMGFITDVLISLLCISCCGGIILLKLPLNMAWLVENI